VEAAVQKHRLAAAPQTFTGSGFSLGGGRKDEGVQQKSSQYRVFSKSNR
jgi:hypothetical protein